MSEYTRQILLVGPYGVLGTGVIDAVAENPKWGITTAARRPAPAYWAQTAPAHISVDLMDREGTTKAFSSLDKVTDLVFAASETVEPNARMLKNTLDALAARNVPLQRIVLAGGAKSYGFSLGAFNAPAKETQPRLIAPIHYHQQEDIVADWAAIENRFLSIDKDGTDGQGDHKRHQHLTLRDEYASTLEDLFDFDESPSLVVATSLRI
jgi:nucleoside-diphosphate-sugar epimerase